MTNKAPTKLLYEPMKVINPKVPIAGAKQWQGDAPVQTELATAVHSTRFDKFFWHGRADILPHHEHASAEQAPGMISALELSIQPS